MTMSAGTEIELKLILADEADFATVRQRLDGLADAREVHQVNYYLDSVRGDLRSARAMLRVRVADGRAVVTCKTKARIDAGVLHATEWEQALPAAAATEWLSTPPSRTDADSLGVGIILEGLSGAGGLLETPLAPGTALHVVGALANTRRSYAVPMSALGLHGRDAETVTFELDRSRFSSGGDRFEIEVERADAASLAPAIHAFLADIGIDALPAEESKYAQMLRNMEG